MRYLSSWLISIFGIIFLVIGCFDLHPEKFGYWSDYFNIGLAYISIGYFMGKLCKIHDEIIQTRITLINAISAELPLLEKWFKKEKRKVRK